MKIIAAAALLVTLAIVISVALYGSYVNAQRTQPVYGYNTPYATGPYGNGGYSDYYGQYEPAPNAPYGTYGAYPPTYWLPATKPVP